MPLSRSSKTFAVEDAKIAPLTADTEGGSATYGASFDVPGIKSVTITPTLENKELRGDNRRLDSATILVGMTLGFEHARVSLDVLSTMLGGAVADTGVTPSQVSTYTRVATDAPKNFKFSAKTPTGGTDAGPAGDIMLVAHKCIVSSYELGFAEEDYQIFSGEAVCSYLLSSSKLFDLVFRETAVALV